MNIPIYLDALGHYAAGVGLSFTDRKLSVNSKKNTQARIERKLAQVQALNYLVSNPQVESPDFTRNVEVARDYFRETGVSVKPVAQKGFRGLVDQLGNVISHYRTNERLNGNTAMKNFAIAYGLELIADGIVITSQIAAGVGNGVSALLCTTYQGLALGAGIQTGAGILYLKDKFRTKQEKEIDATAKQLVSDGKVLSIVSSYAPKANIAETDQEAETGDQATQPRDYSQLGAKAGEALADAAEKARTVVASGIGAIREKMNAKKQAELDALKATQDAKELADKERRQKIRQGLEKF